MGIPGHDSCMGLTEQEMRRVQSLPAAFRPKAMPSIRQESSAQPSPEQVEAFIRESGLDEFATQALRTAPADLQKLCLSKGSLKQAYNPSAAFMARFRRLRGSPGVGEGFGQQEKLPLPPPPSTHGVVKRRRLGDDLHVGQVVSWKGPFGWIQPLQEIAHEKSAKNEGRIFLRAADLLVEGKPRLGQPVEFVLYEDPTGLGAEDVVPAADMAGLVNEFDRDGQDFAAEWQSDEVDVPVEEETREEYPTDFGGPPNEEDVLSGLTPSCV